jgi:hypothetical protein
VKAPSLLNQLVSRLPALPFKQQAKRSERRLAPRCSPTRATSCVLATLEGEDLCTGKVADLSVLGVGLYLQRPVKPGVVYQLKLTNAGCTFLLDLHLSVVRCNCVPDGYEYILGGQFNRRLRCEELLPFVL